MDQKREYLLDGLDSVIAVLRDAGKNDNIKMAIEMLKELERNV